MVAVWRVVGPWLPGVAVFLSPLLVFPVAVLAYEAVGAVLVGGAVVVARSRPRPAYGWPAWTYRVWLSARGYRKRAALTAARASRAAQAAAVTAIRTR